MRKDDNVPDVGHTGMEPTSLQATRKIRKIRDGLCEDIKILLQDFEASTDITINKVFCDKEIDCAGIKRKKELDFEVHIDLEL